MKGFSKIGRERERQKKWKINKEGENQRV